MQVVELEVEHIVIPRLEDIAFKWCDLIGEYQPCDLTTNLPISWAAFDAAYLATVIEPPYDELEDAYFDAIVEGTIRP